MDAIAYARRGRGQRKRPTHGWDSLTPTELQVVELVAAGLTNPQIGERLFVSKRTVQTHVAHVFPSLACPPAPSSPPRPRHGDRPTRSGFAAVAVVRDDEPGGLPRVCDRHDLCLVSMKPAAAKPWHLVERLGAEEHAVHLVRGRRRGLLAAGGRTN